MTSRYRSSALAGVLMLLFACRAILAQAPRTDPAPPADAIDQTILGFDELAIGNEDGGSIVKVLKTAGPKLDYFSVTADAVRRLGLPVRTPGKEFDARRLWVASVDFDRDAKLREAAEKLHTLFKPRTKAKPGLDEEQR